MKAEILEDTAVFSQTSFSLAPVARLLYGQVVETLGSFRDDSGTGWMQVALPNGTTGFTLSAIRAHQSIGELRRTFRTTKVFVAMDPESAVLAELPPGSEVVLGLFARRGGAEWLGISLPDGRKGFIPGDTVLQPKRIVKLRITAAETYLYADTDLKSPRIHKLSAGATGEASDDSLAIHGAWWLYAEMSDGRRGYLLREAVLPPSPPGEPQDITQQAAFEDVLVTEDWSVVFREMSCLSEPIAEVTCGCGLYLAGLATRPGASWRRARLEDGQWGYVLAVTRHIPAIWPRKTFRRTVVYAASDSASAPVAELPAGSDFEIVGVTQQGGNSWRAVRLPTGQEGYIPADTEHQDPVLPSFRIEEGALVFADTKLDAPRIGRLRRGEIAKLGADRVNDGALWISAFMPDGQVGYIFGTTRKTPVGEAGGTSHAPSSRQAAEDRAVLSLKRFVQAGLVGLFFGASGAALIVAAHLALSGRSSPAPGIINIAGLALWVGPLWTWGRLLAALGSWKTVDGLKTLAAGALLGGLIFSFGAGIVYPHLRVALGSAETLRIGAFWISSGFWEMTAIGVGLSAVIIGVCSEGSRGA